MGGGEPKPAAAEVEVHAPPPPAGLRLPESRMRVRSARGGAGTDNLATVIHCRGATEGSTKGAEVDQPALLRPGEGVERSLAGCVHIEPAKDRPYVVPGRLMGHPSCSAI
jgi:hypothetical protein